MVGKVLNSDGLLKQTNIRRRNCSTRSRRGCLNCRKLRIKCDEGKPTCEYCAHRKKECIYSSTEKLPSELGSFPPSKLASLDTSGVGGPKILKLDNDLQVLPDAVLPVAMKKNHYSLGSSASLYISLRLSSTASLLNMSDVDFTLVRFFEDVCSPTLIYKKDKAAKKSFNKYVPYLFSNSSVVRSSLYSYSGLFLWSYVSGSLEIIEHNAYKNGTMDKTYQLGGCFFSSRNIPENFKKDSSSLIYVTMSEYFGHAVRSITTLTSSLLQKSLSTDESCALSLSNMLMYIFLGFHPNKLLQVIDFDSEIPHDYLSISAGVRHCHQVLRHKLKPDFLSIFPLYYSKPLKTYGILPCIVSLNKQLDQYYKALPNSASNEKDKVVLKEAIKSLEFLFVNVIQSEFKNMLAVWFLRCPYDLFALLRSPNYFALRLVNFYSHVLMMINYYVSESKGMWIEYIEWFRNYNLQNYNCDWLYQFDANLFEMVFDRKMRILNRLDLLKTLDPENNIL